VQNAIEFWVEATLGLSVGAPEEDFLLIIKRHAMVVTTRHIREEILALTFYSLRASVERLLLALSHLWQTELTEVVLAPGEQRASIGALHESKR